jgi:ferritin-like metal-binding protein YciE
MRGSCQMKAELEEELIARLKEAHAIESSIEELLEQMIARRDDSGATMALARHRLDARHHRQRLRECLQTHGERPYAMRKAERSASPTDGFIAMHLKIASYVLLEAVAVRAGDQQAARVARLNRSTEAELAQVLAPGARTPR